ncbi:MAG: hypothetical protein HQ481_10820 [Alphaproteobacteria bacterium]|nr:hypothetical protein [Alphaproteobacteria bacterium]
MKRRVFTRRRHAESAARFWVRLSVWLGLPIAIGVYAWGIASGASTMPAAGLITMVIVAIAWTSAVFRLRELTGEWHFF